MLTREQLMQSAKEISALAFMHADETEKLCHLPEIVMQALLGHKMFSIVAPKQHNGLEMDIDVLLECAKEVGRGCGSTGWVLALLGTHNWMASQFGELAQQEMFSGKGYVLSPGVVAPTGQLKPAQDGFMLNGTWAFGSGVLHSDWVLVSAVENNDNNDFIGMRCCAVPISDVIVENNWDTNGMRGTGSNTIVIREKFVPEHRAIPFFNMLDGTSIGTTLNANPMYRLPLVVYLAYTAVAPVIGMGKGAVDVARNYMSKRPMMAGGEQKNLSVAQKRLSEAAIQVEAAEALVDRGVGQMMQIVKSGKNLTKEERIHLRSNACYAANQVKQAVNHLAEGLGAKAQFRSHPLQRIQRDLNTICGHLVFDMDTTMPLNGRVMLGMEPDNPFY